MNSTSSVPSLLFHKSETQMLVVAFHAMILPRLIKVILAPAFLQNKCKSMILKLEGIQRLHI